MATVLVFNNQTNLMERYFLDESSQMPYITNRTMTVREFRGASRAQTLWTDRRVIDTWNAFRSYYGRPIHIGFAFKRIWEGGHGNQSQHYAGTSFDTGQNLNAVGRADLRNSAISFGGWSYVEPAHLTPTWVHFDWRLGPPACPGGGYPLLRFGSRGVYVLILQDALNTLNFPTNGLDGYFGSGTETAVKNFQRTIGTVADGIVGCTTWTHLTSRAVGRGRTPTVID